MDYSDDAEHGIDNLEADSETEYDGRTPLDKTIDKIGMGTYFLSSCVLQLMSTRELSMDTPVIVRIRRAPFQQFCSSIILTDICASGWMADNVSASSKPSSVPLHVSDVDSSRCNYSP